MELVLIIFIFLPIVLSAFSCCNPSLSTSPPTTVEGRGSVLIFRKNKQQHNQSHPPLPLHQRNQPPPGSPPGCHSHKHTYHVQTSCPGSPLTPGPEVMCLGHRPCLILERLYCIRQSPTPTKKPIFQLRSLSHPMLLPGHPWAQRSPEAELG